MTDPGGGRKRDDDDSIELSESEGDKFAKGAHVVDQDIDSEYDEPAGGRAGYEDDDG